MSVFFTLCPSTINNALEALRPQSLRHSSASAKKQELDFMKFKVANRATCEFADSANLTDHRFHPKRRQHGTTSYQKEAPRLCRGGSRSLTFQEVVHRRDFQS